jgi:acyl-CoA synthetase (AMP-forming)/AMP-acid ligase II/acyl carrier protein
MSSDDVLLAVTTFTFDISILEILLPLAAGGRAVIASADTCTDGRELNELIDRSMATLLQATPATWQLLLESGWRARKGLKALCGGEALPEALAHRLVPEVGEVWNMYGPTETTIWSTCYKLDNVQDFVPIGRPIDNTSIYVLNEHLAHQPANIVGELFIGGDGVSLGYHNQPTLTLEKFVDNPFENVGILYRTGDAVRLTSDGVLEFVRRLDSQIKIRGYRIEPAEIEAAILEHEGISSVVARAWSFSSTDDRLVAYFTTESEVDPSTAELRKYLRQRLPDYMIPHHFVKLQEMPLNQSGKIDSKQLPRPDIPGTTDSRSLAPVTETEIAIAKIWRTALGISGVSREDRFFDIGGHSLLAMQVIVLVEEQFGCRLSQREIAFEPLRELATICEKSRQLPESKGWIKVGVNVARRLLRAT